MSNWTKDKPTRDGYYWFRKGTGEHEFANPIVVGVADTDRGRPQVHFDSLDVPYLKDIEGEWSGPIPEPGEEAE